MASEYNNLDLDFYGADMSAMDISIKNMYCFVIVAETKNITKAAERLYTTQSTLSKTILTMEEKLGTPLFIHKKRSIQLTETGDYLYRKWKPIIKEYNSYIDRSHGIQKASAPKITVGCFPLLDTHRFLQPYTDRLAQFFPNTEIDLLRMNYIRLLEHLNADKADIIFTLEMDLPDETGDTYEMRTVSTGNMCAVVPADCPLAAEESIRFSQLRGYNLFFSEPNGVLSRHDDIMRLIRQYNFETERIFYVNNDLSAYLRAEHEHGIALGISGLYPAHNKRVVKVEIRDAEYAVCAVWKKNASEDIKNIIYSILE